MKTKSWMEYTRHRVPTLRDARYRVPTFLAIRVIEYPPARHRVPTFLAIRAIEYPP